MIRRSHSDTGISTCFRKEAGIEAYVRGILCVHQFEKIEQFSVAADNYEESSKEQTLAAFYGSLGFPYRIYRLGCSQ